MTTLSRQDMFDILNAAVQQNPETLVYVQEDGKITPISFNNPHSYRGFYDELAIEPNQNKTQTVTEFLEVLYEGNSETYTGYKGGEFDMSYGVEIYVAFEGATGYKFKSAQPHDDKFIVTLTQDSF